jgi:ABC-type glycerol-3-phosphate transport system permease component
MSATKKVSGTFNRILESYLTVYIGLGVIFVILLSPLVLMCFTAFKTPAETELWPPTIIPHDIDFEAFNRFPNELIDSARIDGVTRNQTLFFIVLPLTVTAIAAGAIITFLFTWNEFLYALTFTQTEASMPLTVGIFEFVGDEVVEWTRLCAVGVFASLPSIIFFIFAQRYVVQGLTAGAIKE